MTKQEAIEILTEMQKWRRSEGKYEEPGTMPFSPAKFGKAIDIAIDELKK